MNKPCIISTFILENISCRMYTYYYKNTSIIILTYHCPRHTLQHRIILSLIFVNFSNFNPSRDLSLLLQFGHDYSFFYLTINFLTEYFLISWIIRLRTDPVLKYRNARFMLWSTVSYWNASTLPLQSLWISCSPLQELKSHFR